MASICWLIVVSATFSILSKRSSMSLISSSYFLHEVKSAIESVHTEIKLRSRIGKEKRLLFIVCLFWVIIYYSSRI